MAHADARIDRLVNAAARPARDDPRGDRAGELLEALGMFPAGFAPRVVRLVLEARTGGRGIRINT